MPLSLRLFAFTATAASGIAVGYGLLDKPPAQINLTEAEPAALRPLPPVPAAAPAPIVSAKQPTEAAEVSREDAWTLLEEAAVFDDLTNVYLSVPSEAPLTCGARRRASLMLRCLEDRTAIYVAHDCATPPIDPTGWKVDLRLDQNPVEQTRMQVDSRGEALGHWEYQDARILIERLTTADRLHLRFTDDSGVETAIQFPVGGLADHLETLTEACHWSGVPPWEIGPQPAADPEQSTEELQRTAANELSDDTARNNSPIR